MTSQTPGGLNTILGSYLTILAVIRSVPFPPCQVMLSFACSILAFSRKTLHQSSKSFVEHAQHVARM